MGIKKWSNDIPRNSRWKCVSLCFAMDTIEYSPFVIPKHYNLIVGRELTKADGYRDGHFVNVQVYDNKYPAAWLVAIPYEQIVACFRPMEDGDIDPYEEIEPLSQWFNPEQIRGYKERHEMNKRILEDMKKSRGEVK